MALLKVVRLLGRFDGVQYLLAYDDETLYRTMSGSGAVNPHDGSAERFMEKIVQYPLFVPPLLRHQQLSRLNAGLATLSRPRADADGYEGRLSGLADCFVALLTTPRAIDRYIAQLEHHIPLLSPEEVDDEDVQLLTLIRVSCPALFNLIPRYRSELISGHTGNLKLGQMPLEYESFDSTSLFLVVPDPVREFARRLLVSLFPKVRAEGRLSTYASRKRQSVQHDEYFDRYFAMDILGHDISDAKVAAAVEAATCGDGNHIRALLIGAEEGIRGLVLSKGTNPSSQPSTDAGRIQLAKILASVSGDLSSDDTGPFDDQYLILSWIADLLVRLSKDAHPELVRAVIEHLDGVVLKIRAWRQVENRLERAGQLAPPLWFTEVTAQLVRESAADFLTHLKQGDSAAAATGVGYQVNFVLRHDPDGLRSDVLKLFSSEEVDLAGLASRLVSARTILG